MNKKLKKSITKMLRWHNITCNSEDWEGYEKRKDTWYHRFAGTGPNARSDVKGSIAAYIEVNSENGGSAILDIKILFTNLIRVYKMYKINGKI